MKHNGKQHFALFLSLVALFLNAPMSRAADFDDGYRFIFYAVMEGCYDDGLLSNDVAQILLKNGEAKVTIKYLCSFHLRLPRLHSHYSRPRSLSIPAIVFWYSMKTTWGCGTRGLTSGPGLSPDLKKQLYSKKAEDRLAAINTLMQRWVSKRMSMLRLSDQERAELQKTLEEMRKKGTDYLKNWEKSGPSQYDMSAFKNVHQCAVCNGACGLNLKPDAGKQP